MSVATVWVVDLSTLSPEDLARCDEVLSPAEEERAARFFFERDRLAYRAAHGLARLALSSRQTEVRADRWTFAKSAYGRPEIDEPASALRFNLSHTRGAVACIVARERDCGVDVEPIHRANDLDALARSMLTSREQMALAARPADARPALFCRYWTLKEAFAKARGLGISLSFETIGFDLDSHAPRLCGADADRWHFAHWLLPSEHVLAAAIASGGDDVEIALHHGLPPR